MSYGVRPVIDLKKRDVSIEVKLVETQIFRRHPDQSFFMNNRTAH